MAAHGYIFPISDHVLTLKDDGTLYRFQVGEFWYETMARYQEDFSIVKLITTIPAKLVSIKVNAVYPNWGEGPPHGRRVQAAQANLHAPCPAHFHPPLNAFSFTAAAQYLQPRLRPRTEGNMCHTRSFSSI